MFNDAPKDGLLQKSFVNGLNVDERRKIKKRDVIAHVYQRPLLETPEHSHVDKKGKVEFVYDRIGKKLTSRIDSFTDNVKTIQVNNVRECKKHGIVIDDSKRRTFAYERNLKPKKH